jgi:hypothetical protein
VRRDEECATLNFGAGGALTASDSSFGHIQGVRSSWRLSLREQGEARGVIICLFRQVGGVDVF